MLQRWLMPVSNTMKARSTKATTEATVPKRDTVIEDRVLVFRNLGASKPDVTRLFLILPKHLTEGHDGRPCHLHDWRADYDKGTIYARGSIYTGNGNYLKFEGVFPCLLETLALEKPGRNFEWNEFGRYWRNTVTGKRVNVQ